VKTEARRGVTKEERVKGGVPGNSNLTKRGGERGTPTPDY